MLSRLQAAAPGTVVATIAGHTHQNGYRVDAAGIHHVVLPGLVETPPGRRCHGWLDVFTDRLVLNGVDTMQTLDMAYTSAGEAAAVATATAGGGGGGAAAATAAAASVASAASASAVAAAVR